MTYGLGTRSFNRSTENRQMKKERAEFTARYLAGEIVLRMVDLPVLCNCRSFRYSHELAAHRLLKSDRDWRTFEQREREGPGFQEWGVIR